MRRRPSRRRRQGRSPAELFVAALGLALLVLVALVASSPSSCRGLDVFGVPHDTPTPESR